MFSPLLDLVTTKYIIIPTINTIAIITIATNINICKVVNIGCWTGGICTVTGGGVVGAGTTAAAICTILADIEAIVSGQYLQSKELLSKRGRQILCTSTP